MVKILVNYCIFPCCAELKEIYFKQNSFSYSWKEKSITHLTRKKLKKTKNHILHSYHYAYTELWKTVSSFHIYIHITDIKRKLQLFLPTASRPKRLSSLRRYFHKGGEINFPLVFPLALDTMVWRRLGGRESKIAYILNHNTGLRQAVSYTLLPLSPA